MRVRCVITDPVRSVIIHNNTFKLLVITFRRHIKRYCSLLNISFIKILEEQNFVENIVLDNFCYIRFSQRLW